MKRVRRLLGFATSIMAVLLILVPFSSRLVASPAAGASSVGECLGQFDTDEDGFIDCVDNCPVVVNDQTDSDTDGVGDACDCDVDIDTTDDGDDGECIVDCTLREAIDVAPGGCAIRVPAGLYSLVGDTVVIDRPVTLLGDGAVTTILDAPGVGFRIAGGTVPAGDVFLQGVTISRSGISVLSNLGIATLYLSNSVVRDGLGYGVGVGNVNCCSTSYAELRYSTIRDHRNTGVDVSGSEIGIGHVIIDHCLITGNGSTMHLGGGIFLGGSASAPAWVFVNDSVVSDNTAYWGGGIYVNGATDSWNPGRLWLVRSTVSGNTADKGGGICVIGNDSPGIAEIESSTFISNSADEGGAAYVHGILNAVSATVVDNSASVRGGGIYNVPSFGSVMLRNTILADNLTTGTAPDCGGAVTSGGFNLIEDLADCTFASDASDITGESPDLGSLGDHGGPTPTLVPLPGSLAIDNGGACLILDQRGVPRSQGIACDIGSVETAPDSDGDGVPDLIDGCPFDLNKDAPGVCGCGEPDVGDLDGDGALDCVDGCPTDPDKTDPGMCGCGVPEVDTDGDGVCDSEDPCPDDPDFDGDGYGQLGTCHPLDCDDANPNCTSDCTDFDGDGYCVTSDCSDSKPHCALVCIDNDSDTYCGDQDCNDRFGSCTTECIDEDSDGLPVCAGDCDDDNQFCGTDCTDTDDDGYCDEFDCDDSDPLCNFRCDDSSDNDLDGVPGSCDNCPVTYNPGQRDSDGDGAGDICDVCPAHPEFAYPSFTHLFDFPGNGQGSINGLATDSSGKIYLADAWSQTIGVYSPAGSFIFDLAGPFGPGWVGAVFGLTVGPTGKVHSADAGNWEVNVYQENGTFLFSFSTPYEPVDVAVGGDGRIYYTLPEQPGVFFRDEAGGSGGVIGSAGNGAGQYRKPWGVAVDSADNVYVTDWWLDIVIVYDSSGNHVRTLTGAFDDPVDVVVDAARNVYVADWGNERVVVFDAAGVYQAHFSTPGPPGGGVSAGLNAVALSPEENILVNFRTGDALVKVYSRLVPDDPCPGDCVDFDADGVFDCDGDCGVVPCGDCDGSNPYCGLDCTDADTDDYCADFDCDDANPMCSSDCTDIDLDDYCVTTDCDDTLDWLWAPPGPAGGLAFDANSAEWSWDAPLDPGGLFWTYDVIRSEVPTDFLAVAHCVAIDVAETVAEDTLAPPPGHGYYYLVRARNDCGEGSLGQNSFGNARPAGRPCP